MDPKPEDAAAAPVASALAQAVDQGKKKKKKKKKKKLSSKKRRFERLEKLGEKVLDNPVECNELLHTVSFWLEDRQKLAFKLFHQQALATLDHDMFKKTVKVTSKKKKKKGKKSGKESEPEPEPEPEPEEENPDEQPQDPDLDPDSLEINTIDSKLTYDDFKMVLTDLGIPCTEGQLHALCKLLDPEKKKKIDFRKFTPQFLKSHLDHKIKDGIKSILGTEKQKYSRTFTFQKDQVKYFAAQYPLYVKLDLKLVAFANDKEYFGHIKDLVISIHEPIYELIEIIKERTDIASSLIQVYKEASKSKGTALDDHRTLEYYGYTGDTSYNAAVKSSDKIVLFYDFALLENGLDPILHCDFYFNSYSSYVKK